MAFQESRGARHVFIETRRSLLDAFRDRRFTGMGKIPNYFKSAQKELLSLGGKLIDKMKEYDKDNIPTKIIDKIGPYIEMEAFTPARSPRFEVPSLC